MPNAGPEWISATKLAVDRASDAVQAHKELTVLSDALKEFDAALEKLAKIRQASALGRGEWWPGLDIPSELWFGLDVARRELSSRKLNPAVKQLNTFVKQSKRSLEVAWSNHVRARTGHIAELHELAEVLTEGSRPADVARDLRQARESLNGLQRGLPDADAVRRLNEAMAQYEAFESALPPAVNAFVSAVARGGASIRAADAEVIAWLTDNGALDNFKIVAGAPPEVARG
ncbi:hypothetical protein SAMN05216266_11696 [Amycolatopsis marina]|uniref:Uncharacterized protein n=1 Tax=Amycolatopsis marina TaxID=490629 RepID=A0A1I1BWH6_9PSEU|nr:hypothetical protein [Amycolatopsis marina]SFB52840.1 hypothetical protein SAMN05216266_11696 [Amycolatopsis marina]